MHDLVIRGGTVVDGTGASPKVSDVAIDRDRITAIGEVRIKGAQEIDARDHLVTPGFVDAHTHLDAQVGWDPYLTPSSWHGVTTVLLGNCGVTFAPVRPDQHEVLAGMMESVEDIPQEAILTGMAWDWEHYGEYLNSIERSGTALNVAGMVGHSAVRTYVMGDRAVGGSPTDDDIERMADVVRESIAGGAVGFSTSRHLPHTLPDGRFIPGTTAPYVELLRIAKAMGNAGGALFQNVLNVREGSAASMELLRAEADACGRALFSTLVGPDRTSGERSARYLERQLEARDVTAMTMPRSSGTLSGLSAVLPYKRGAWEELARASFDDRLQLVTRPPFVNRLLADAAAEEDPPFELFYSLGSGRVPDYVGSESLLQLSKLCHERPAETWIRLAIESGGRLLFNVRRFNPNLDAVADLMHSAYVIPGLGDAGAHVGQIMDAGWTSFVLSHWVRDSKAFAVEDMVHRMTDHPARLIGARDRGRVTVNWHADLNVIDLKRLTTHMPELVHDFPGGTKRFIQRAEGYRATIVNGEVILENDELTCARPGKVLRGAAR